MSIILAMKKQILVSKKKKPSAFVMDSSKSCRKDILVFVPPLFATPLPPEPAMECRSL